jgi:hypothetical protein
VRQHDDVSRVTGSFDEKVFVHVLVRIKGSSRFDEREMKNGGALDPHPNLTPPADLNTNGRKEVEEMIPSRGRTSLVVAAVAAVLFAPTAARAAQDAGTWSGTVAAVQGDDVALVGVSAHFRLAGSVTEMASGRSLEAQNLAPGTSVTLRVGERGDDGRLRADHVEVESRSVLSVTGSIGRISDDRLHVEVQGVEIELDRHTRFSGHSASGSLRSARDLRQGASITASLVPTTSGTLRAAELRPASGTVEAGEDQELKGVVTAVSDAAWTIDGKVFTVNDQTRFEGDPAVGDLVEVKFHDDGTGASIADRIEIEDDANGAEVEFVGIVEAIGGAAWTISGQVVGVDASTRIDGSPQFGSTVEVHATRAADGSVLAATIQLEDGADDVNNDHGSGNDDGSNHDAGDDHGGQSGGSNPTPTTGGGGSSNSGNSHGHGSDDSGADD